MEQKQIEKENIATKENLAKQAEFEKQRTITQAEGEAERQKLERIGMAEGEAEAIRVKAIADAEATRIKAQAQAEANTLIAESLDPNVINWQAIQNWSGNYPLVMGGGSVSSCRAICSSRRSLPSSRRWSCPSHKRTLRGATDTP